MEKSVMAHENEPLARTLVFSPYVKHRLVTRKKFTLFTVPELETVRQIADVGDVMYVAFGTLDGLTAEPYSLAEVYFVKKCALEDVTKEDLEASANQLKSRVELGEALKTFYSRMLGDTVKITRHTTVLVSGIRLLDYDLKSLNELVQQDKRKS